jgi:hypothetical protein
LKNAQITLHIILNLLLQQLVYAISFTWKTYDRVLKSIACMPLVRKAADEIRITIFFIPFGENKINELAVK